MWSSDVGAPVTHSIAAKLFRRIFSVYFVITAAVTAAQLAAEYREEERRFQTELRGLEDTFREGIDDAVWHFNREGLKKILYGMLKTPTTLGVEVRDRRGDVLAAAGVAELTEPFPLRPAAGRPSAGWPSAGWPGAGWPSAGWVGGWFSEPIFVTFPVTYVDEQQKIHQLGSWTVHSNRALLLERLKYRLTSIFAASLVKTAILLAVFMAVFHRELGAPLKRLRRELEAVNAADHKSARVSLGVGGRNELTLVEETLNDALDRLNRSNQELRKLAEIQEQLIEERTRELQVANAQLAHLSETDPLTGLNNRRKLESGLEEEWRRHRWARRPLSAIMLDVDHFKAFNDAYGHRAGDECLRRVGSVIVDCLRRSGDLAARYGGEEFIVILPETDAEGAAAAAEAIRAAVQAAAIPHAGATADVVTVSIGAATARFDGDDANRGGAPQTAESLVDTADRALYAAKRAGRNRVFAAA